MPATAERYDIHMTALFATFVINTPPTRYINLGQTMKSIFKTVALITIFSVITRILGFVFKIFLSRKLGAELLGTYQVSMSVISVMLTLVSSGLPLSTAKYTASYIAQNREKSRASVLGASLVIALILSGVLCILVTLCQGLLGYVITDPRSVRLLVIMLPAVFFSSVYCVFRGAMWGKNDYFSVCITEFAEQVVRIALTVILLSTMMDKYACAITTAQCFSIACTFSALLAVGLYFIKGGQINFHKGEYRNIISSSSAVTGVRVVSSLVQPLSAIVIPAQLIHIGYTSAEAMSAYGVMMGMVFPLLFVPMAVIGSLGMVLIPNIAGLMSQDKYDQISTQIKNSILASLFVSALFVPLYLGVGDMIGVVLYDNVLSGTLLQLSAIAVVPIALCNITSSMLNALNLELKSFRNYVIGALVMFVSLFVFTKWLGINSIVLGLILCMSTVAMLNIRMLHRRLSSLHLGLIPLLLKYTAIALPCSLLAYLVENALLHLISPFFACVIGGVLGVIFMALLLNTFGVFQISQIVKLRRQKKATA